MSISSEKRTITALFSTNQPYFIDFYQRDYKWRKEHIQKLLEDLFYRFNLDYKSDYDVTEQAISEYDWYYMNTYVTNIYNGHTFIVDGQQRFTSLTLILIKLLHLTRQYTELEDLSGFISDRIAGRTPTGREYWMGHSERKEALEDLFNNDIVNHSIGSISDLSLKNLYQNYIYIGQELGAQLTNAHRLQAFSLWFLQRVMLVQIEIAETKDVPMVFEVINDRGERLKPYEVLKGKLLGQIPKEEIDAYHTIWQTQIHRVQDINEDRVDDFFRTYFRSKYVTTHADYREFDGDYHKTIYETKWNEVIKLKQNVREVKRFIKDDFSYYADLYTRIITEYEKIDSKYGPYLFYNNINNQDRLVLLILSACTVNDKQEKDKIQLISRLFDQHFSILQLTNSYDSNNFTESLVALNQKLRNKSYEEIDSLYQQQMVDDISKAKAVEVHDPYDWNFFKDASKLNLGDKFVRYFFARVEHFIYDQTKMPTADFYNLARNTGPVYGYHIEHIVANNDENMKLFDNDDEKFRLERNRLGALLLLRGPDNLASNNESYQEKVKTYEGTLLWNQTLHPDFYHKKPVILSFDKKYSLGLKTYETYDGVAINDRQWILFKVIQLIWPWGVKDTKD
jgi:uncharacterized protein with ParB-like and HNH nuclease domain